MSAPKPLSTVLCINGWNFIYVRGSKAAAKLSPTTPQANVCIKANAFSNVLSTFRESVSSNPTRQNILFGFFFG